MVDFSKLLQKKPIPPEEAERLAAMSKDPCPGCGGSLTVGELECEGCCTSCYFNAHPAPLPTPPVTPEEQPEKRVFQEISRRLQKKGYDLDELDKDNPYTKNYPKIEGED